RVYGARLDFSRKIAACGCHSTIDPSESGDLCGEGEGLGGAACGLRELTGVPLAQAPHGRRDGADVARIHDRAAPTVHDRLGAAGHVARNDRDARRERFEIDVAERLVAARQHGDVSGGIPPLDVAPRAEPCDAALDSDAGRLVPERTGGAPTDDDE